MRLLTCTDAPAITLGSRLSATVTVDFSVDIPQGTHIVGQTGSAPWFFLWNEERPGRIFFSPAA